jgi:hypothetical protein
VEGKNGTFHVDLRNTGTLSLDLPGNLSPIAVGDWVVDLGAGLVAASVENTAFSAGSG